MEIWIKYLGDNTDNYTRYGKTIPIVEKKIDVQRFFGLKNDQRTIEQRIKELEKDKKLFIKRHKGG